MGERRFGAFTYLESIDMKPRICSRLAALMVLVSFAASGCVSIKPGYNSDEQAMAERGVSELHRLYNNQDFAGIYSLFDDDIQRTLNREEVVENMKDSFARMGMIQTASLNQVRIFPVSPIEVRMVYYLETEKGQFQEWFIWVNRDGGSRLIQVQTFPGHGTSE